MDNRLQHGNKQICRLKQRRVAGSHLRSVLFQPDLKKNAAVKNPEKKQEESEQM